MRNFSTFFFALSLFLVLTTSCKKEEEPVPPTKTELLTKSSWTGTTEVEYTNGVQTNQYSNADLKLLFKTNGTVDLFVNNIFESTETWSFTDNETKIVLTLDDTILYNIEELSETTFKISYTYISGSNTYKYVDVYVH